MKPSRFEVICQQSTVTFLINQSMTSEGGEHPRKETQNNSFGATKRKHFKANDREGTKTRDASFKFQSHGC